MSEDYDDSKPMRLKLRQLQARDLKDKSSMMDKQDPALVISVGDGKPVETARMKDHGVNADFPETPEFEVDPIKFKNANFVLDVEAFNVSVGLRTSKTHLGKARTPLNSLITEFNKDVPLVIDLMYNHKKGPPTKEGRVLMTAVMERAVKPKVKEQAEPVIEAGVKKEEPPAVAAVPVVKEKSVVVAQKEKVEEVPAVDTKPTITTAPARAVVPITGGVNEEPEGTTHHLFISKIVATGLKNVEMMPGDKNDPYTHIKFGSGGWEFTSSIQDGAGTAATWEYNKQQHADQLRFPVTLQQLDAESFTVTVSDKNNYRKDTKIGTAQMRLPNALVPNLKNTPLTTEKVVGLVVFELKDAGGKAAGTVTLHVERDTKVPAAVDRGKGAADKPKESAVDASAEDTAAALAKLKHTLFISKISGKGLKSVERGFMDKNDDYVKFKFGANTWSYTTDVIQEGGSDPVWEYNHRKHPQMKFAVSLEELQQAESDPQLSVEVWDKNKMTSDVPVGSGKISIRNSSSSGAALVPSKPVEERVVAQLTVDLLDDKGKAAGSIVLDVERESKLKDKPSKEDDPDAVKKDLDAELDAAAAKNEIPPFETGQLLITQIVCKDLVNVESMGGKNDPYVTVNFGAEERTTDVINEGGANVNFEYLNFAFDVDKGAIDFEPIAVHVFDKNTWKSDKPIGSASSSVRFMQVKQGVDEVQLPLSLYNAQEELTGKIILFLTLKPTELKTAETQPIDPNFKNGHLQIHRVSCSGLKKPKSMLGSSYVGNPLVKMTFGSWQYKTAALSLSKGTTPLFDHLDLSADVTAASLETDKLVVEVFDKGSIPGMGDTLVGRGECSVRNAGVSVGTEQQFSIDLVNDGAASGQVLVFVTAAEKKKKLAKEDIVVPKEYEQGFCRIKAITAHNLRNTEMFGKQDPYIVLEFPTAAAVGGGSWKDQTEVIQDAGSDGHWKNLDFKCEHITRAELHAQDLLVTAFDDNAARADVLIGSGKVSLLEAAGANVLGSDVELEVDLVDDKGTPSGRIVLLCSMHAAAAPEDLKIPDSFTQGVVKVKQIVARGLKTGNLISRPAPSIHVKYGSWEDSTGVGEGSDFVWEHLDLQSVPTSTAAQLASQPFEVTLKENGKAIATGSVPNLLLPGSQPDTDVDVTVMLVSGSTGAPAGKVTLTLNVGAPAEDIAELAAAVEEAAMPEYEEAVLLIKYIRAEGLKSTELIGQADPFIVLTLGGWQDQTEVRDNAGGEVIWDKLEFREEFSADTLVHEELEAQVFDKNSYRKNVLLGQGKVSMKRVAYSMGKEVDLVIKLLDEKGTKSVGRVLVRAELREQSKDHLKQLPADFTEGILHIFRISAFNIPNTELVGKQDPFVVLKLGQDFEDRTPTMDEAGSDPIFDFLDIKARVTAQILENQMLEVEAWEDNTTGNIQLGTGCLTLHKKITTFDEEVQLRANLKDKKGKTAGRVLVFAKLIPVPATAEEEAAVPLAEGFSKGTASIRRICAFGLTNTDLFGGLSKQDPYVMVKLDSGGFSAQTEVKDNAGVNCMWDLLDMEMPVDVETLQTGRLEVQVMNKNNMRAHSLIGSGTVSIRRAGTKLKEQTELSVDLLDKNQTKPAGRVVLYVEVNQEESEADYTIPPDFQFGHFKVSKISAFGLKNVELLGMGKQDPYVQLSLGEWSEKTFTQDNAGDNAKWDFLAMGCDVRKKMLTSELLEVALYDANSTRKDVLVGAGTVSLMKCVAHLDQEVELKVTLQDTQAAKSGKVVLTAMLAKPEPIKELPEDFVEGSLKMKRVSVFGLKNSEMFGLSKGDPYIVLKVKDFTATTKVLNSAGENPIWNHLDFETVVNKKAVRAGELVVEAWEKNSLFSDKLLATAEIPLKPAGGKLEKETELIAQLKTEAGDDRGKVNVLVQLDPIAALSLPDLGLPEGFLVGVIKITGIRAEGLQNKEFMGSQDPYICVTVGDWSETTDTLDNAGANATWTGLEMLAEVNAEILAQEQVVVRVMDENSGRADSVLGAGAASLRKLCERLGNQVELKAELVAENGKAVGTVTLTAVLEQRTLEDLADALPAEAVTVKSGQMVVRAITACDLKGGDSTFLGGKQDPYIMLEMENEWSAKTDVKDNAGRKATWDHIDDIELAVTQDILKYKRITVTVFDKNSMRKDAWMGQGDFSLRKLGSKAGAEHTHVVRLKDKRGKAAGRVTVTAMVSELPDTAPDAEASAALLQSFGKLDMKQCFVKNVKETATLGKQDLVAHLSLPAVGWKKKTELNKSAGTATKWAIKETTAQVAVAQLTEQGVQVEVYGRSAMGEKMLGRCTLPMQKAIHQPGEWVTVMADLTQKNGTGSVGKFKLELRFSPKLGDPDAEDDGDDPFADLLPGPGDENFLALKESQEGLHKRVGSMEDALKASLRGDLEAERDKILQAMADQNQALTASITALHKELANERKAKNSMLDGLVVSQVNSIKLPSDVRQWRSAHVQAWVSVQKEFPEYVPNFQKASIDGLVLLKHVNLDTLQNALGISDMTHCQKLLEGIRELQTRQDALDEAAAKERARKLQKKKEEEERRRQMLLDLQRENDKKNKKEAKSTKKKKKKKTNVAPKTYLGEVREQNVLERTRIEREMRQYREGKRKQQEQVDSSSRTWKFEYTGAPQPKAETIWDQNPFKKSAEQSGGSAAYRRTMALDILSSNQFTGQGDLARAPSFLKVRPVPRNCAPEEVLVLVKGAMYEVSNWLVEMEKIEFRKRVALDSDLVESNDDHLLHAMVSAEHPAQHESSGNYDGDGGVTTPLVDDGNNFADYDNEEEEEPPPPSYEEIAVAGGEEDDDAVPPPPYEEVAASTTTTGDVQIDTMAGDVDDDDVPPPAYEEALSSPKAPVPVSIPPPPHEEKHAHSAAFVEHTLQLTQEQEHRQPEHDRMKLIFNALVGQQNNNARWLGANDKLTRMKLYGGCESLLRLKIEWPQFDALWTKLDYKRSGDIDLKEFKAFFGDLADFERTMGTQALSTTAKSKSISALTKCLFELCDALRGAGFTVVEMFSGFDRNGSGDVSISEFCSMLRLVVGNNFEKRLIYQALNVLDTDGDKAISLEEVLRFVYRIWKSQLDELADRLGQLDDRMTGDEQKIQKILSERKLIKDAIKKNFPREWRDRLEREGGHTVPGPFQALLTRMDVGATTAIRGTLQSSGGGTAASQSSPFSTADNTPQRHSRPHQQQQQPHLDLDSPGRYGGGGTGDQRSATVPLSPPPSGANSSGQRQGYGYGVTAAGGRSYRPSETWSPGTTGATGRGGGGGFNPGMRGSQESNANAEAYAGLNTALFTAAAPLNAPTTSASASAAAAGTGSRAATRLSNSRAQAAGQNEIMRFKIKLPAGTQPTRSGTRLQVPQVHDMNRGVVNSAEVTSTVLQHSSPFEGYG